MRSTAIGEESLCGEAPKGEKGESFGKESGRTPQIVSKDGVRVSQSLKGGSEGSRGSMRTEPKKNGLRERSLRVRISRGEGVSWGTFYGKETWSLLGGCCLEDDGGL